jgi:hypothetical protein
MGGHGDLRIIKWAQAHLMEWLLQKKQPFSKALAACQAGGDQCEILLQ